jgi:membrane-associated phospholipid phosphatase
MPGAEGVDQLPAAGFQRLLWDSYQGHLHGATAGIAAFPSLHGAVPAYLARATRPDWWRWPAWLLTLVTWFCSVLLGWHYLVDGTGGILVAVGACLGAGLIPRVRSWR